MILQTLSSSLSGLESCNIQQVLKSRNKYQYQPVVYGIEKLTIKLLHRNIDIYQ